MVQFDFGNKQFTEWLLSFDIDRRSQLLTKVQQQLAQMGLRADQMQRALQQICQRTAVQVHRLPEDITMYMQRYVNDDYSNRLRNYNSQGYRRQKYNNERPQFNDIPDYRTQYEDWKSPNLYREGNRDHYERSKYSDNNHPFRPVGREYFKWKNDHQSSSLQRRMKNKQRFCYSYDNEERRQMVNYQQNNLRERYYYEEEAVLSRKVPSLGRSLIDRTELSLPEGENSIQRTQKYRNCTKTRYFKDTKCKLIHFVETNGNKSEKKQVSYVEKCAKSVNCNTNIISTKLQKTDSVEIDTKNVNKLTNSTKTKKQILSSNKSTNKNVETSSLYNVTTDTEVFKKHTDQDDASDKVLETIASAEKIVSDNLVPSEEGHSLPSDIKLMNSNTNIGPYQSVSLHQNCALTSKSEVKNKSVSNFSNAHCSGSEIRSPLSFESSEHKTLPSSDTAFESVLSSTSHCSEDRKRSLGIGSRIKDGADSVRIVGTPARATTTTNNSKVISKCLTDSVKKTSPQCYTTIDEYYNFKAKRSDKEVSSNTSSTYLGGSGFKTHCSSRTQSTNCNSKDLFKATSSNQNKRGEVKTLNSAVKSNFQQELDRISKPRGMVVGTSDFDVLDNKKRKENKTHQHVSKKKRGIGSESPLDKELAISEVKASKELAISEVSNPLNNPYSRIKEIPQVTNVTLKHGLLSVQRRSSTPASSSSDKFKRKRSHSYDGEQSNLFRQVDILKEDNAPISKVKKNVSKEESLAAISTALKEKEHKKVVPLDNNTQAKKFYSQSAPSQKNKLFVLKDRSKRTVPYYSDNLSTKKRKKIIDLFGEEDFEDPAIKELNKSDEKSQILQNESEQSSEQSKNEQQNMTSESLVNPLPKSIHQNKNTETLNKMADNECPSVIKSSLDCIPETIIGTKIIPAIKELSKSDEKSQTLQNELEQSSEQSKNEQQNVTSESIIGTKVIPAMKELSKSDEKSQTLQNELEQSSEQSKNEQQNMTSKSLVNPLPEKIHQNKNTEPLNKMADNKCPSVINSALDYIPETIIGTKIIPAIKELSKSDEKSRTLQTESEQSSEQSKNEQQNMTSKSLVNPLPESIHQNRNTETLNKMADNECPSVINSALDYIPETIIGTKVIPAMKELSKSDEKSPILQNQLEQSSEQSKNEQQNMTSKSLVNQLPESIHQNKITEPLNKMADNECPSVINSALDYIPETIIGTKIIPAIKELSKSDEKSRTLQTESEQSSEQSKNEQQNMTSKSLVNPLPESIHQNRNTETLNKMADNECPSVINSALDYIPETIIGTKVIPAIKELSKSDEKSQTLQTESEQFSEQSKNEQQNMTSKSLVNQLPESIHQNKNTETLNKMADNECPSVIKDALDYIPETIMGTKVIAEDIEVKVEINMDTIPLLFPGPQDGIPSIVKCDSEKETEKNKDTVDNEKQTTLQSTSSISDTTVALLDRCEKNKQPSFSAEDNRHLESLVVQDTLQSEMINTLDSDSNITKDPLDINKQIPETSKVIETSDPGIKKSIVTGVSENNHIEENSMLQNMEDSANNMVNNRINVILSSHFPEKTLVTSSVFQRNISHVSSASTTSNEKCAHSDNFQTFNTNDSVTTRPVCDRQLCHSKEGIIEPLQHPQASTNEFQNHAIINPCDNQVVKSTSEVVQMDSNPSALSAVPTCRIRVRDPAYLGISANYSKTSSYDKTSNVSLINADPTKNETTQSFSFPAMDKNLQQLAEITYTMLHDKDRCLERIKAANSLTSLTDIKSSEKDFAKRDFFLSLLRKVEIYCKLLTTVNMGMGNETETILLCRVNSISKEKKYTLHDVKEMKAMALEMENKRLKKKNSNNEAPRLLAAHPHLDSNVSTRPVPSIASQNAVSIQISHNPNSNNALSSSHEIGRIAPQPCSNKTTESVSQIQSNIVQNVQNRSNQVFDGNSVRPPPPLYISHSSSQRNFQKPETSPGRTTTQNTAGHPPPPYPVYSITHITNHQNQPILNSSYQQNSAPPSGIFNNSIVQPTQKNHQGFPHPTPHRSTANTYHHKPMAPQIGFKNSSVNTLYQQKQVQLTSSCPKQSIIPNITVNQQNQVLQQTPLHGSLVQTPSQQKQIPQMGCGSALHSSNQLSYQHHNNIHASQYPANNYKDMQSGVQHPSRHQPLVHALLAAGSCLTVPSYQNLGKMCHKQQDQQLRIEQKLPQIQKPANPSSAFPVLPQIRSHQHLLQFYQQYQNQQHEKVSQHQNKQQESLQPQEQPHLRQFQQSLSYLELGQRQHQPIQIQQNQLQQHRHQLEKHQAKKRCIKEQMQQTHKQHQQEQLQPIRHQQEHLLQSQRHQQGQLIHPQQWHKQSQLQQCTQKKLKQQYQLEQMQFSQQNQQGLVHQIQHQQEQFQQNHQLPPPPDLLRLQSQSQKESQLLPISLRHMERMVYDNLNYGRQLQSNSLSPNLTEVAPNAIAHSQNSVLHQMSNLKNASNIGATRQNSLGTKFQQNTETINQVLTKSQTSIYQSVQHPTTNSNLQQSPPQSDTSTSLVPAIIPAKQKQLASCLSSESCKGISDNYLHARRLVPEVVKEQATINIPNSDVHENARRLVPEVIKEQATINIPNSDVHENARRLVPEVVKEKATINIPNSHVHENISTLCPLDNVPNLGKDNPMKNATFNNNNKHISSENERESTGPEILHSEQMTSNSEYQPPLESEITLSGLLRSGVEYFSTMIDSHITDKHKQLKMRGKQISDTSIDDQRPVPEVTREQVTENLDDIVANVGNCDFNTEENNSKQSKQIDNGNIDAAVIASHSFSQLQTREKRCISSKSKANSTNTIKANPTMSSEGESQSKIVIVNKHCDRISTESLDIMEIAIKPNDEPTMQNCKKPKEGARGQRDMPSLDDIGDKVICSPLNDCMPIDQDDVDIEVIGEFLPQLRTLSRDSGYTTPTTFAIKEDDNDVMLFEEETVKIEDHSENMNFYEINKFEDQESNQALSKDIKSCFETEEMELPSSSSDDTLYSRIKIERGGLIYMELDKDSCCAVCEDSAQVMCSGCKSVTYCSETCQVKDWKEGHYLVCLGSCSDT